MSCGHSCNNGGVCGECGVNVCRECYKALYKKYFHSLKYLDDEDGTLYCRECLDCTLYEDACDDKKCRNDHYDDEPRTTSPCITPPCAFKYSIKELFSHLKK